MATIRLGRFEAEQGNLPLVCMCCGGPTDTTKKKQFSWHPPWVWVLLFVGLLPCAIVALLLTKKMKVVAPLCEKHNNHWSWRTSVLLAGFLMGAVYAILALTLSGNQGRGDNDPLFGVLCFGGFLGATAWVILALVLNQTSIRPTNITDRSITLIGVSEVFVEAVVEERRLGRELAGEQEVLPLRGQTERKEDPHRYFDPNA